MTREEREAKMAQKAEELRASGHNEEAVRRMLRAEDAKRRQADRERAWLLAHPHRFIKYNDKEPAFCIACKQKLYEKWLEDHEKGEKEHHDGFEEELHDNYEDAEEDVTAQVHRELLKRYESMEIDVKERYEYEEKKKDVERFEEQMIKYNDELLTYKITGAKAPIKPMMRIRHPPELANTTLFKYRRDLAMSLPPEFVPMSIHYAKLSHVDPNGLNILPEDEVGGEALSDESTAGEAKMENEDEEMVSTEEFPLGLRLRVWDKSGGHLHQAERGPFLGQLVLNTDDLLRPPSGIRTYPLKNDVKLTNRLKEEEKPTVEKIQGSITVQLKILKKDKRTEKPVKWRLDIQRMNRIAYVDRLKKTAPYVEVFWCGPATKDDNVINFKRWIFAGITQVKPKTIDPTFDKSTDLSLMEFPPVWTDLDIPLRGDKGEPHRGGGWCAQNQVPEPPEKGAGFASFGYLKRLFRKAGLAAIVMVRMKKNIERRQRGGANAPGVASRASKG